MEFVQHLMDKKPLPHYIDTTRKLLQKYDNEEISFSKFVEDLNIEALTYHNKHK